MTDLILRNSLFFLLVFNSVQPAFSNTELSETDRKLFATLGTRDISEVQKLLKNGANINAKDLSEPLIYRAYVSWASDGHEVEKMEAVAEAMGMKDAPKLKEMLKTMKESVARSKPIQPYIEFLLKSGANPNIETFNKNTTLHFLCKHFPEAHEQIKHFVQHGANPNLINSDGDTPIHLAVQSGNRSIVQILAENRGDLSIQNRKGYNPLDLAIIEYQTPLADHLKSKGGSFSKNVEDLYKLRKYKKNDIKLYKVETVPKGLVTSHVGIARTGKPYKKGELAGIRVTFFGEPKNVSVALVDAKDAEIRTEIQTLREDREGASLNMAFQVKIPDVPFKIRVMATSLDGVSNINQIDPMVTSPQ